MSHVQVQFPSNASSSRKAIASSLADDGFPTMISKAQKRRVTEEHKMIEISIDIQAAKTAQSVKKLDPSPGPAKSYHLRSARKRTPIDFPSVWLLICFVSNLSFSSVASKLFCFLWSCI